jgi:hypothetical protein
MAASLADSSLPRRPSDVFGEISTLLAVFIVLTAAELPVVRARVHCPNKLFIVIRVVIGSVPIRLPLSVKLCHAC